MHGGTGFLLLGAVAGYWVLERAESHRGQLKQVGQVVGWVVLVTSLLGVACKVYAVATGQDCPAAYCPFKKSSAPAPATK